MLWPDGKWTGAREKLTTSVQRAAVEAAATLGKSVIISDTNLNPQVQEYWRGWAKRSGYTYKEQSFLDVPLAVCIERDLKRLASVGEAVIRRMWLQYVAVEKRPYDPELPDCIIVDIDGTLSHNPTENGKLRRGFYDWHAVGNDDVHEHVADIVRSMVAGAACSDGSEPYVVVLTGRDGICYDQTAEWLRKHGIHYDELYSRAVDDQRKDSVVKRELFDSYIEGRYNPLYVIDDRQQVVDMWVGELGLEVLHVLHPQVYPGF